MINYVPKYQNVREEMIKEQPLFEELFQHRAKDGCITCELENKKCPYDDCMFWDNRVAGLNTKEPEGISEAHKKVNYLKFSRLMLMLHGKRCICEMTTDFVWTRVLRADFWTTDKHHKIYEFTPKYCPWCGKELKKQ